MGNHCCGNGNGRVQSPECSSFSSSPAPLDERRQSDTAVNVLQRRSTSTSPQHVVSPAPKVTVVVLRSNEAASPRHEASGSFPAFDESAGGGSSLAPHSLPRMKALHPISSATASTIPFGRGTLVGASETASLTNPTASPHFELSPTSAPTTVTMPSQYRAIHTGFDRSIHSEDAASAQETNPLLPPPAPPSPRVDRAKLAIDSHIPEGDACDAASIDSPLGAYALPRRQQRPLPPAHRSLLLASCHPNDQLSIEGATRKDNTATEVPLHLILPKSAQITSAGCSVAELQENNACLGHSSCQQAHTMELSRDPPKPKSFHVTSKLDDDEGVLEEHDSFVVLQQEGNRNNEPLPLESRSPNGGSSRCSSSIQEIHQRVGSSPLSQDGDADIDAQEAGIQRTRVSRLEKEEAEGGDQVVGDSSNFNCNGCVAGPDDVVTSYCSTERSEASTDTGSSRQSRNHSAALKVNIAEARRGSREASRMVSYVSDADPSVRSNNVKHAGSSIVVGSSSSVVAGELGAQVALAGSTNSLWAGAHPCAFSGTSSSSRFSSPTMPASRSGFDGANTEGPSSPIRQLRVPSRSELLSRSAQLLGDLDLTSNSFEDAAVATAPGDLLSPCGAMSAQSVGDTPLATAARNCAQLHFTGTLQPTAALRATSAVGSHPLHISISSVNSVHLARQWAANTWNGANPFSLATHVPTSTSHAQQQQQQQQQQQPTVTTVSAMTREREEEIDGGASEAAGGPVSSPAHYYVHNISVGRMASHPRFPVARWPAAVAGSDGTNLPMTLGATSCNESSTSHAPRSMASLALEPDREGFSHPSPSSHRVSMNSAGPFLDSLASPSRLTIRNEITPRGTDGAATHIAPLQRALEPPGNHFSRWRDVVDDSSSTVVVPIHAIPARGGLALYDPDALSDAGDGNVSLVASFTSSSCSARP